MTDQEVPPTNTKATETDDFVICGMRRSLAIMCSVGDMFDKDKIEKSHNHHRYVCCIGSSQKTIQAVLKGQDGKVAKELKIKKQSDNVLKFLNGANANAVM